MRHGVQKFGSKDVICLDFETDDIRELKEQLFREKVKLSEEAVDPDDIETLEDLVMAATNEALRMADAANAEAMNKMTGGLSMGGGFPF